jgi:hypothetical protein
MDIFGVLKKKLAPIQPPKKGPNKRLVCNLFLRAYCVALETVTAPFSCYKIISI